MLISKNTWRYLDFIFDRKLSFCQHINFYANKMISMVKYMKILGNSTRGLNPQQKCLLYRSCTSSTALYRFQLWYYSNVSQLYSLKSLGKLQRWVAIWILGAFKMASSFGLEAITGLIPIYLYFQKLSRRSQLRVHTLPTNHILRSLMDNASNSSPLPYSLSLSSLTKQQ